ncbi:uncharacterized protein TRIADDRAFT_20051 [Trichoplax adhaerens]|uniref:tRNA-5-taurinomethyluridine 2-sulfurtransferase n=1 Tax=Trichoplax adhaerens TaxID=10228 RepID=B3RIL6_TRIAD|nr:hypothetical protein TRIADDRAFT_20051 [Trichoplax adhaerens]EDV29006.1 hypothetical protein TRIADDRAFT_20051 [Trichoplax adhaerens]|eukprot:XP_002108208.1 hypothetical protein TRIADDRAFT_20051 [Trichoplax adhaerens]
MSSSRQVIAVAMSGGVDSTIAAYLLRKQGHEVVGIFMKNWDITEETGICKTDEDMQDFIKSCNHLGIPHKEVNFVQDYWHHVFSPFVNGYKQGITPNPDITCNRMIKFNKLRQYCSENLGVDNLATGHYAQLVTDSKPKLIQAVDEAKDQTYFLANVKKISLKNIMFPIGNLLKSEVKNLALKIGLRKIATKKESMGVCFIGKRNFKTFISEYIENQEYDVNTIDGQNFGKHSNLSLSTIGERARIGGMSERWYVVSKDSNRKVITLAPGINHPALYCRIFYVADANWISYCAEMQLSLRKELECHIRIRHLAPLVPCLIKLQYNGFLEVNSQQSLFAVTPGQFAAFYSRNECLGGGQIVSSHTMVSKI